MKMKHQKYVVTTNTALEGKSYTIIEKKFQFNDCFLLKKLEKEKSIAERRK